MKNERKVIDEFFNLFPSDFYVAWQIITSAVFPISCCISLADTFFSFALSPRITVLVIFAFM